MSLTDSAHDMKIGAAVPIVENTQITFRQHDAVALRMIPWA